VGQAGAAMPSCPKKQKPPTLRQKAQHRRRFFSRSRFHSGLSLRAGNGGHPHCDTQISRSVLSRRTSRGGLQTGFQPTARFLCPDDAALLCPDKRIYPFTVLL
jgi:hypothetical protein